MIRKLSIGLGALCFVFGVGCGSADEPGSDTQSNATTGSDMSATSSDNGTDGSEIGTAEQAITMPVDGAGGASQCVSACTRVDTKNITGVCCVCNGATKTFARSPTSAVVYLCK